MNDLILVLERAERALFSLSHGLRHQCTDAVLSDPKNGIMESIELAKAAIAAAQDALGKLK